jgi:hypothetical protein
MANNANALTALNRKCQPYNWTITYLDGPVTGVPHAPTFTAQVVVTNAAGDVVVTGASGDHGYTRKTLAEKAACAAALALLNAQGAGAPAAAAVQRLADAWLGDRSLLLLLGLLGSEAGLSAAQMHTVSALFTNEALAPFNPQQLGSVYATATALEATLGAAVAPHAAALTAQLLPALQGAAPELIAALQAAVAAAAAQQQ